MKFPEGCLGVRQVEVRGGKELFGKRNQCSYKGKEARKSLSCLGEGPSGVGGVCER